MAAEAFAKVYARSIGASKGRISWAHTNAKNRLAVIYDVVAGNRHDYRIYSAPLLHVISFNDQPSGHSHMQECHVARWNDAAADDRAGAV